MENSATPPVNQAVNQAVSQGARVYAGQVELLYAHALIGIAASILNGAIMVVVLWKFLPHFPIVFWGLLLAVVSIARILVLTRYRRAQDRTGRARRWGKRFLIGMACSGMVWGVSAIWMFHVSTIELHILIAFVIGGMVAGASATLSALRSVYYAFAVPSVLPLTMAFFVYADLIHVSMGVMMILFTIFLSMVAHSIHGIIRRSFQLRFEKDDLIFSLEQSRREMDSAFETLRLEVRKRREVETELRLLSNNLEREVQARTRELEHANRELNAFAYSVSHDLRAPVRAIEGFSRVLQQEFGGSLGERGRHYLATVRQSAERMNDLIDDILLLSRVSRQGLNLRVCDLTGMAHEIADTLQKADPSRQADFFIQEGLTGQCDHRLLRVLLENLLNNAWKFTRKTETARIEFGARIEDGKTIFFVADNGVGFDMAYVHKLFIPFQRLHSEAEFEGTGIGLATVQRIIRRHGGSIWAKGDLGKGAIFFFTLKECLKE